MALVISSIMFTHLHVEITVIFWTILAVKNMKLQCFCKRNWKSAIEKFRIINAVWKCKKVIAVFYNKISK